MEKSLILCKKLNANSKLRISFEKGNTYYFNVGDQRVEIYFDSSERFNVLKNGCLRYIGYTMPTAIEHYNREVKQLKS